VSGLRALTAWSAARWRRSLVMSLTLIGIAAVGLLAALASAVMSSQIRTDALSRAQATAEILARSTFAPRLPRKGGRLARPAVRALDAQVAAARASEPGTDAVLRTASGTVLYASPGATRTGAAAPDPGTRVIGQGAHKRVQSVLPVERTGRVTARAAAYLALEAPYAPVARDVTTRTRRLNIILALAALAVYLLVLPTLVRAGRAVRAQYDPRRAELARDIKRAIKQHELSLVYQPIVESDTQSVRSVEALVRWTDPRRGPIAPATFIPALEATPTIWNLSADIFEMAFAQCAEWCRQGHGIPIAVNVSGAVLLDRRLIPELRRLSVRHRIPARMIELEITEGAIVRDPAEAARVLKQIGEIGLSVIAIDDFGTGYSSLARLHELPLNTLKIDQSFVMRMARDGNPAIVGSVIDLAHALGMDVIAEGVEDGETADQLGELGAEYLQGYHLSRPLPPAEIVDWLEGREPRKEFPAPVVP
jgi:EAL domain-containing protein (putative c-di-GMP-specific phosphodiesterase class I)